MSDSLPLSQRLEQYTLKRPQEVLFLHVEINGQPDEIVIFRGFSSSLMQPTAFDPDIPVLAENAVIHQIDRLKSPYQPDNPQYLEQGLTLAVFEQRLAEVLS
jgi:hypothetical protein